MDIYKKKKMMKREYAIDKLIENADKCINMLDLCHKMGIENVGGENYREIKKMANELGITLKFSYKRQQRKSPERKTIEELLVENSECKRERVKRILFKEGLKEEKCEICGISEWNGKPISLQLHHLNGVCNDNRIENLQILCPNCHAQTETYAGKNSNTYQCSPTSYATKKRRMKNEEWDKIKTEIWEKNHPSKETLIEIFLSAGSFLKTGKLYGVSDNAIRKWFKHYGLPFRKKELLKYIQDSGRVVEGGGLQNR